MFTFIGVHTIWIVISVLWPPQLNLTINHNKCMAVVQLLDRCSPTNPGVAGLIPANPENISTGQYTSSTSVKCMENAPQCVVYNFNYLLCINIISIKLYSLSTQKVAVCPPIYTCCAEYASACTAGTDRQISVWQCKHHGDLLFISVMCTNNM